MADFLSGETNRALVWIGAFRSRQRSKEYFLEAEHSDEDATDDDVEGPISEFAASQGVAFYDHDWLEVTFLDAATRNLGQALEGASFSTSYLDQVVQAAGASVSLFNTTAVYCGDEIETPCSATGDGFHLDYLGSFEYDPRADSVLAARRAVISESVRLALLTPGHLRVGGELLRAVTIDARGLIIGCGGSSTPQPYLDLAQIPGTGGIAATQLTARGQCFDHGNMLRGPFQSNPHPA